MPTTAPARCNSIKAGRSSSVMSRTITPRSAQSRRIGAAAGGKCPLPAAPCNKATGTHELDTASPRTQAAGFRRAAICAKFNTRYEHGWRPMRRD
jgi:hypothetical protein